MMTSFGRLKVIKKLDYSLAESYLMLDPRRSGEVLLYIFPEASDENRSFLERLETSLIDAPGMVFERGDLMGVRYIISAQPEEFQSLVQRIEGFGATAGTEAEPQAVTREMHYIGAVETVTVGQKKPAASSPPPAGEFTRLFASPPASNTSQLGSQQAFGNAQSMTELFRPLPVAAVERGGAQLGEFTNFFQTPPIRASQIPRVAVSSPLPKLRKESSAAIPIPAQPAESPSAEPVDNERTVLFERLPAPAAPHVRAQEPSDFARFFESPLGPSAPDINFEKRQPSAVPAAPRKAGDFTSMFGKPFSRDVKRQPSENPLAPAGATGVFAKGSQGAQPINIPLRGSGDYTGIFDSRSYAPRTLPAQLPALTPAAPAKSALATSTVMIVGVLATLLIVALALIIYFALRR